MRLCVTLCQECKQLGLIYVNDFLVVFGATRGQSTLRLCGAATYTGPFNDTPSCPDLTLIFTSVSIILSPSKLFLDCSPDIPGTQNLALAGLMKVTTIAPWQLIPRSV
jgi:hypothetical protein